jgi:hypothetical protein
MNTRVSIAFATLLVGTTVPAAAVYLYEIDSLDNAIYVSSSTSGYDTWAATCANVRNGTGCNYDTNTGFPEPNNNKTLFFWGNYDGSAASTNSRINVTWNGSAQSATIESVRLTTLRDDDGSMPAMGPIAGPRDLTDIGISYGPPTQGAGLFLTYARAGAFNAGDISATIPTSPLQYRLDIPDAGTEQTVTVMSDPFNLFQYDGTLNYDKAVEYPVELNTSLAGAARAPLQPDQTASLVFYNEGQGLQNDAPIAYMSDFLLQFNPPDASVGAQVGIAIDGLPSDNSVEIGYDRTPGALTTTIDQRAGTPEIGDVTYRVFNQGASGSLAGDGSDGSYGQANGSGDGLTITDGGSPSDSAALEVGERTGERSFNFAVQGLDLNDTGGKTATLTQTIFGGTDGDQTQIIDLNSVGPILGVNDGAENLDYESGTINLGEVDLGGTGPYTLEKTLTIANLFGEDLGELTNLTIANTGIGGAGAGAFNILRQDYANGDVAAAGVSLGDLEIQFAPANVGWFNALLFFDTDMNRLLGDTSNRLSFELTGRAINSSAPTPTPTPGTFALLAFGLAAFAGVRGGRIASASLRS